MRLPGDHYVVDGAVYRIVITPLTVLCYLSSANELVIVVLVGVYELLLGFNIIED